MNAPLETIFIFARDMGRSAAFYGRYFGFETAGEVNEGLMALRPKQGGSVILIHQAAWGPDKNTVSMPSRAFRGVPAQ